MKSYHPLTREERYTIECLGRKGHDQSSIAEILGRHKSTLSRELKRNTMTLKSYCHTTAQKRADHQAWGGKTIAPEVWAQVEIRLRENDSSPVQISCDLKKKAIASVSHETIYQYIYRDQKQGGGLHTHLRHRIKSYRKRGSGRERRGRLKDQIMIDQRPPVVDERSRLGDWEMDTMIGIPGGPVLVTMVERYSRYTVIELAASKEALNVSGAILEGLNPHRDKVLTTTYDNGKEFAHHKLVAELLDSSAYFAHPYHSWERGLNENTNGLIRQYFPKGFDFSKLQKEDVKRVQNKLNTRPRKCIDFDTPYDIFFSPPPVALAA
jgi:IS30 family transposase